MNNIPYWFIEAQTYFCMPRGARMSLALKNRYRYFFVQTSTPTPSINQKVTEFGKCCMQNDQLRLEVKDNAFVLSELYVAGLNEN